METIIENELVKELANQHGRSRESLIPILQDLVVQNRFLSKQDMVDVARELDISAADVYGTATFYTFLDTEVRGKYIIRICKTISCAMKGKNEILNTIEEILKMKNELYQILADHSGKPIEQIEKDSDRDHWMTAKEALEYGMIDEVLEKGKSKKD